MFNHILSRMKKVMRKVVKVRGLEIVVSHEKHGVMVIMVVIHGIKNVANGNLTLVCLKVKNHLQYLNGKITKTYQILR